MESLREKPESSFVSVDTLGRRPLGNGLKALEIFSFNYCSISFSFTLDTQWTIFGFLSKDSIL